MTRTLTTTVLGRSNVNDLFPHRVAERCREYANLARTSIGDGAFVERQIAVLGELADYVLRLSANDQGLYSLVQVQAALGGSTDGFDPGERQVALLSRIGGLENPDTPTADEALNELIGAGLEDALEAMRKRSQVAEGIDAAKSEIEQQRVELEEREQQADKRVAEIETANQQLTAQVADLTRQITYLRGLVPGKAKPRKVRRKAPATNGRHFFSVPALALGLEYEDAYDYEFGEDIEWEDLTADEKADLLQEYIAAQQQEDEGSYEEALLGDLLAVQRQAGRDLTSREVMELVDHAEETGQRPTEAYGNAVRARDLNDEGDRREAIADLHNEIQAAEEGEAGGEIGGAE